MSALIRNATWSGFSAAVRAATGLLIALLAVRLLGGERYGQLATMLSLFVLYLSFNSSIFTVLVSKLMAMPAADPTNKAAEEISAAAILAGASIAVLGLLTMLLWKIVPHILSTAIINMSSIVEIRHAILAMSVLTALQIMTAWHSSVIEGAGRLDLAMKWQLVGSMVVATTLFLLLILHVQVTGSEYVSVLSGGAFIDLCLLVLVRRKLLSVSIFSGLSYKKRGQIWVLLKSGATLQGASLMSLFLEPLNKFLLNHFIGPLAVTAYDLAMKVIWGIQSLFAAAMRVFLHLSGEQGQVVGKAFSRVLALVLVPVLIVHTGAAIFMTWVAHHWVTIGDTRQFVIFFSIATVSNLGMIYITPLYISLIGRGDFRFVFQSQTIVAVTNVLVSVVLIPPMGLLGAAVGLMCATAYNVVAIYLRHERKVGESGALLSIVKSHTGRYMIAVLLFVSAILIGVEREMNYFAAAAILLSIAILMKGEPIVGTLLKRLKGRQ